MTYDPGTHHRRSTRLREFDYRTPGCYVVTICSQHRVHLFGEIVDGEMVRSPSGEMIQQIWDEIPAVYPEVDIDAFVVMPNHVHGIIVLPSTEFDLYPQTITPDHNPVGATPCGCPFPPEDRVVGEAILTEPALSNVRDPYEVTVGQQGQPQGVAPTELTPSKGTSGQRLSLPDVVHRFKTFTTYQYGEGVKNEGWQRYRGRLWQRNYYERVVRNEAELTKFRNYIEINPARWFEDPYRS